MRAALAAMLFGALALVLTGAPESTGASPSQPILAAHGRLAPSPAAKDSTIAVAAAPAGRPTGWTHLTAVPAGQLQLHGSGSPEAPVFLGRSRTSATGPTAPAPRTSTPATAPASLRTAIYNGLNHPGIAASDNIAFGIQTTPPDSTGAIGPNHYVEMANSIIHVWDRNLGSVSSAPLHTFGMDPSTSNPYCDPQVQWDPAAGRWLAVFIYCNLSSPTQAFIFAWSKTSDPSDLATGWCVFGVQTGALLLDYPKLGHNSNYIIIGGNLYDTSFSPPQFASAGIAWATLPANGVTTCPVPNLQGNSSTLFNGDLSTLAFTPVPVNTMTNAADGYIVSAYDAGGNVTAVPVQSRLAVWHVDSSGVLNQDSDVSVPAYTMPPSAPQAGSTNRIDTLDGRLTQAVGDPVSGIWTQHTVAGGAGSKVTWYQITASGASTNLVQSGDVTSATDFVYNAAISPSFSARGAAIFYNRSSATLDPVIAAQVRANGTASGTMAPGELLIASSTAADSETLSCNKPDATFPCRWGDYSGASPDPVQTSIVWGTNEINTAATILPAWRNQNFAVWAAVPPGAPTIVGASSGQDSYSCVTWTPSNFDDGGAPDLTYTIRAYQGVSLVRSVTINAPASLGCINGLTDGTVYTLTVTATNVAGVGAESAHSGPVTPARGASASSPAPSPTRAPVNQAPPATPPATR